MLKKSQTIGEKGLAVQPGRNSKALFGTGRNTKALFGTSEFWDVF